MAASRLEKLKKLRGRSFDEIRQRGEQALSAYGEQLGFIGNLPSDEEFSKLLDAELFGTTTPRAEQLLESFGSWRGAQFFPAFEDRETSVSAFRENFGDEAARQIIARADRVLQGKFDLLGFSNLDFGLPVDWHLEPISGKRAPLNHWKQFDELDSEETGDKKIIWELNRCQHFFTLGAAYWLSGDEKYAAAFVMHLTGWMEQNPPATGVNWMSSLEIAFRAISWMWALNFFKNSPNLTPTVFRDALKFIYLHARHIETYLSTFYSPNTHLTGEALGLYYLGTLLPEFRRSRHWREIGRKILLEQLNKQILPDGVYFERTTWYQRYTTDFYTHFYILSRINEDEFPSEKLKHKLQLACDFLMHATRPDGTTPLIGDDDGGRMLPVSSLEAINDFRSTLATAAVLFKRGDYKFVAKEAAEETFWLLGATGLDVFELIDAEEPHEKSKAFPIGGYFVTRRDWSETADYLLIDSGAHGSLNGGHAHADALSFELAVGGKTMLVDAGTYSYAERAARDYFRSTQAHNTLALDGKSSSEPNGTFDWKTMTDARTKEFVSRSRFDFFEGLHDGFSSLSKNKSPIIHTRSLLHLKNDYWILRDTVNTKEAHDYQLNFHFNAGTGIELTKAENELPTVRVLPETGKNGLEIAMFGDNGALETFDDWISPCYGVKLSAPTATFSSSGIGTQEFFTFLLPSRVDKAVPVVNEIFATSGRAFTINSEDRRDLFVYGDDDGLMTRTTVFDSNFRFAWARFSEGEEQLLEEIVLVSGSRFVYGGREVINYPKRMRWAYVRRKENKMFVETDDGEFSVSLPKKARAAKFTMPSPNLADITSLETQKR
ncbi:MAG: heparinase II/III family protein [Acidobacteriota bacterium]|nr:heparinase II/III family protein [Acidobacteriota bacterium]